MATKTFDDKKTHAYTAGAITKLVKLLEQNDIHSREDFFRHFDDDATPKQYELLDGVGPKQAQNMVMLRGLSQKKWRDVTGLPVYSDAANEAYALDAERGAAADAIG